VEKNLRKKFKKISIHLCGFSFSGKTTAGREFAKLTRRRFIDSDSFIEKKLKTSPKELILSGKEEILRKQESKLLKKLLKEKNLVVAWGAGVFPPEKKTRASVKGGLWVFLKREFSQIEKELKSKDGGRPLLSAKTYRERKKKARKLYLKRLKYYSKAALTLKFKKAKPKALALKLKKAINEL